MNDDTHPSMQRLFTATGMQASELARALDTSPQNITNWSARGISKNGALLASRIFGLDARQEAQSLHKKPANKKMTTNHQRWY